MHTVEYSRVTALVRLSLGAFLWGCFIVGMAWRPSAAANEEAGAEPFEQTVAPFFTRYCVQCHGEEKPRGEITLHKLSGPDRFVQDAQHWERILEALSSREMPPEEEKQPTETERAEIVDWINARFEEARLETEWSRKLLYPEYGNLIGHEMLFDGSNQEPAYTPSRLWKKSPYQFESMVRRGLGITKPRPQGRDGKFAQLKQPFTLEEKAGIKDFAAILFADSATLGTLLRNAEFLVDLYLEGAMHELDVRQNGPTPEDQLPQDNNGRPIRPRFQATPAPLAAIVLSPDPPTDEQIDAAVALMYELVVERPPAEDDLNKHRVFMRQCIAKTNNHAESLRMVLIAIAISPQAVFRLELGQGEADEYGRRMLSPANLAFAIAYSLTDQPPDAELVEAAKTGRLRTRADVAREVTRLWDDTAIDKPRILRFFHEFFGYDRAPGVFKDDSRYGTSYSSGGVPKKLIEDADMLVNYILQHDQNVLAELLTTEKYYVAHSGDNETTAETVAGLHAMYEHFKDENWKDFPYNIPREHGDFIRSLKNVETHPNGGIVKDWMNYLEQCHQHGVTPIPRRINRAQIVAYGLDLKSFDYPVEQPFVLDKGRRAGILMHPAWLIAHSLNLDNDLVRRGKWIRERLLAENVPEVPITVDAAIPDEPDQTLRHRFRVTAADECWRCHVKMNPLGLAFENFDDFGRPREVEMLLAKGKTAPVDASGVLRGTGNPELDGEVRDAFDLVQRLAKSERVRQSFVRHAFRYWMGRNEMPFDSATLIAADQAYVSGGGSFRALVLSLLTSDSFLYRKTIQSSEP